MATAGKEIDIIRNIKALDHIKSSMLSDVAGLHKALIDDGEGNEGKVSEKLSGIILSSYIMGRRLGISFNEIEGKLTRNIRLGIIENSDIEKYYGDLSELSKHLEMTRQTRGK